MKHMTEYIAEILKLIGQKTRIKIIEALDSSPSGELFVNEILSAIGEKESNTSRHLSLMTSNGILLNRKETPKSLYRNKGPEILEILDLATIVFDSILSDPSVEPVSSEFCRADILKALGQPEHIKIVEALRENEMSTTAISTAIGGKQSNTSRHLSSMVKDGLLINRVEGKKKSKSHFTVRCLGILDIVDVVKRTVELETRQRQEQSIAGVLAII
jgi:DNA-binding transcriptional ArsR family regulator